MAPTTDFEPMFDLAPVSLWLEDYSGLKRLFDQWRSDGIEDIAAHLRADAGRVAQCMAQLKVLKVNRQTLKLFGATSQDDLVSQLHKVFSGDMSESVIHELTLMWQGVLSFDNQTVNYTLDGRRLDVQVRVSILPGYEANWERVLVSLDDITEQVQAQTRRAQSERYAQGLFEQSPVSLWVEDFSAVKRLLDEIRQCGISDFSTFLKVHPEFVARCMQEIRVIDVNHETLRMFGATDKDQLLQNMGRVFRDEMRDSFAEQLQDLWNGKTLQRREVVNYALGGDMMHIHMQFAVLDDHLSEWDLVLVSLIDITARKKAEAYLEFLGKHDVLTKLRNRTFYSEELNRLSRKGPWPISVLAIDLNGLKQVNDESGHAAGDALLRRAGEVLSRAVESPACVARIGGDEFSVLMPMTDAAGAQALRVRIDSLLELNNQFYSGQTGHVLSFAIGVATCQAGELLDLALQAADRAMYHDKAQHYARAPASGALRDRRAAAGAEPVVSLHRATTM